jgi:hypothetical protein
MTIKLSDIPQRDAFEILAAATKNCAVCYFRDQLAFTTQQLCNLLRMKPQDIDEIVAAYPAEILIGEVFMAIGDELLDLLRVLGMENRPVTSARLWTPRAALRIAALMTNPVAKAIHTQVAAYVALIEAQDWMIESPSWLDSPYPLEAADRLTKLSLSSINELPPLQPELATPPNGNRSFQPELATFSGELATSKQVASSEQRKNADYSTRNTANYKIGHSQ